MSQVRSDAIPWEHESWPDEHTHEGWTPEMIEEDKQPDSYFWKNRKHRPFLRKGPIDPESFHRLADLLVSHPFRFARSMPDNPHWYTLRKEWQDLGPSSNRIFNDVNRAIREHGYTEWFGGAPWQMFNVNGNKYWNYYTSRVEEIVVLNRKPISGVSEPFDEIAIGYDDALSDPDSLAENDAAMELIGDVSGLNVLDIGCGTGLLLDYMKIPPKLYTGLDPSERMLDRLWDKHPEYTDQVLRCKFEEFHPETGPYDLIVSLFGSPSYIGPEWLEYSFRFLKPGGRYVFMFLKEGYTPVTYERLNYAAPFTNGVNVDLPGVQSEIGQFVVLDGRKA